MKRYIRSSTDMNSNMLGLSQERMAEVWAYIEANCSKCIEGMTKGVQVIETDKMPFKYKYYMAKALATETANKDNFYMNSIGMWERVSRKPKGMPDFDSTKLRWSNADNDYYETNGSLYWYTSEGVYRNSDHWNGRIASCSWYIDDEPAKKGTGFIRWSDIQPKGYIWCWESISNADNSYFNELFAGMQIEDIMYSPEAFVFAKQRYYI